MKHFSPAEWIDFVNQVVSPKKKHAMEEHLGEPCNRCSKELSIWQRVHRAAQAEPNYQPPSDSVRAAKSVFADSAWAVTQKQSGIPLELLFDSFLQPVFEGARSSHAGARQMLYRADPYQIDLLLEPEPGNSSVVITGQLLNVSHPEVVGSDVPVKLSNLSDEIVEVVTDQFGEFRETIRTSGDLEVRFLGANDKPIVITLRDALGRSNDARLG